MQSDCCYKKGKQEGGCTRPDGWSCYHRTAGRHRLHTREQDLRGNPPAGSLILGFHPPQLWGNRFCIVSHSICVILLYKMNTVGTGDLLYTEKVGWPEKPGPSFSDLSRVMDLLWDRRGEEMNPAPGPRWAIPQQAVAGPAVAGPELAQVWKSVSWSSGARWSWREDAVNSRSQKNPSLLCPCLCEWGCVSWVCSSPKKN